MEIFCNLALILNFFFLRPIKVLDSLFNHFE